MTLGQDSPMALPRAASTTFDGETRAYESRETTQNSEIEYPGGKSVFKLG